MYDWQPNPSSTCPAVTALPPANEHGQKSLPAEASVEIAGQVTPLLGATIENHKAEITIMYAQRLWCNNCKTECTSNEAVEKEVDTMFGDGRWWHCRHCGTKLILYPEIGEKEEEIIHNVQTSLIAMSTGKYSLSPAETCDLLFELQEVYAQSNNRVDACHVLFNIKEIAQQNNLPEYAMTADKLYQELAKITLGLQKERVLPVSNLLERFVAYYYPQ